MLCAQRASIGRASGVLYPLIKRQWCTTESPGPDPGKRSLIWFCKPGHEKLLAEEIQQNTEGPVSCYIDKGWIRTKQRADTPLFTEPAWGRVCMHNYEKFSSKKESALLDYALQYSTQALKEMMSETSAYNQWHLFAYEAGMKSHQGVNSALGKNLRKKLIADKQLKNRMQKKGSLDTGDMMLQMFMPTKDSLYISAAFADSDALGRTQPLSWLGGHYQAKHAKEGPSRADTKIQEALAHFDVEMDELEGATFLELGGAPGGWTQFLLANGALVTSVDLAPSEVKHPNHTHHQGDAREYVDQFADGVDWLVADLSMPPDKSLDLLSQFLTRNIPKRFLWAIKFAYHPNDNWNEALVAARTLFRTQFPQYHFRIRHMFYQKREILIWGQHQDMTANYHQLQEEAANLEHVEMDQTDGDQTDGDQTDGGQSTAENDKN